MKRPLLLPLRRQAHLLFLLLLIVSQGLYAQQKVQLQALETPFLYQPGQELLPEKATSAETADQAQAAQIIRCWTMESDTILRQKHPEMGSLDDFESWMSRAKQEYLSNYNPARDPIVTIPIIFHVIHNGEATGTASNLNAIYIQAQIDQLNDDYRRLGAGFNTNPVGADIEVEFCAAILDPSGNLLAEPGINRINRNTAGFSAPPYSDTYIDNTVKPATQWDPTQYFNVWVANIGGGLLGWAQFPSSSGLAGMPTNGGAANTDGVVVLYTSVGSIATPHPNGGIYAGGRTLTHEAGHFFGLRHIWGDDAVCNTTNDYCGDTPDHSGANLNCPTGESSCGIPEMPENYMDYTQDNCMNIFTADQKLRMRTVLNLSPRRASLTTSNRCTPPGPYISFNPATYTTSEASTTGANCQRYVDISVTLNILTAPTSAANVSVSVTGGTASNPADAEFVVGSVTFPAGSAAPRSFTLRVYDDALIEATETLTLAFTITNAGSTDAQLAPSGTTASVSITDNDKDPMTGLEYVLFSENFEGSTAGWATGQFIGNNNQNRWLINTTNPLSGTTSAHISPFNNTGVTYSATRTTSTFLRSPLINATTASNMELSFLFRCNGELLGGTYYDYGRLLYSLDGTNYFVFANNIQGFTANTIGTIALPAAVNNTSFYLAFGWVNDNTTANNPPFIVDDITIRVAGPKVADDLGASRDHNLSPGATVHFFDEVSGDIIATIENQGTYDYGCTDVTIDRAGTGAVDFWDNAAANNQYDLASKTVIVKPANNNPGTNGNYRITLYYTQAEVNGWQTATGGVNALNNIKLVKSPDSIKRVSPGNPYPDGPIEVATPVANGTLSGGAYYYIRGAFTSGFSGFGVGIPGTNPTFPIEYTFFEATPEQGDALLTWEYVNDNGILYFELERSLDGVHFETFTTVDGRYAPQGRHMLSHKDLKVGQYHSEILYYRIKGADANGQMYQSEVREMHLNFEGLAVKAYPNPFGEQISIDVLTEKEGVVKATLLDGLGRSVLRQSFELSRGLNLLSIDSHLLSSGVYTLVLEDSQNRRVTRKLTK